MASRALARLPRSVPTISHRCFIPSIGHLGTPAYSGGPGESRQNNRYEKLQGLPVVTQTRDIHLTRRNESTVLLAGLGVAVGALAARYALIEFRKNQVSSIPRPLLCRCIFLLFQLNSFKELRTSFIQYTHSSSYFPRNTI